MLFNSSIAENIKYGREDATTEEVRAAALQANAAFVEELPEGFATQARPGPSHLQPASPPAAAMAAMPCASCTAADAASRRCACQLALTWQWRRLRLLGCPRCRSASLASSSAAGRSRGSR